MLTTTINVFAYNPETRQRVNSHAIFSRSFQGAAPIPNKGDRFGHLSWTFPVFNVLYTYLNHTTQIDISVWAETDEQRRALADIR